MMDQIWKEPELKKVSYDPGQSYQRQNVSHKCDSNEDRFCLKICTQVNCKRKFSNSQAIKQGRY